jgi:hypothetical protein
MDKLVWLRLSGNLRRPENHPPTIQANLLVNQNFTFNQEHRHRIYLNPRNAFILNDGSQSIKVNLIPLI